MLFVFTTCAKCGPWWISSTPSAKSMGCDCDAGFLDISPVDLDLGTRHSCRRVPCLPASRLYQGDESSPDGGWHLARRGILLFLTLGKAGYRILAPHQSASLLRIRSHRDFPI